QLKHFEKKHFFGTSMEHYDKIRLVVVGDSGVGKTSLVHILCHNEALRHPTWTIGCSVHVKMHTHSRNSKTYFVEFIDVGGTSKHKSSRNMFYHQINGIILVHDVSNRKSYHNLWKWIAEVIYSEAYKESERVNNVANANWSMGSGSGSGSWMSGSSMSFNSTNDYDFELQIGERHASVPILVVGTKADLVKQELTGRQRRYSIVDEYGGECVNLCTLAPTHFAQNSISAQKIDAFFEKVIDKKFGITTDHYQNVTSGSFTTSIPTVTKKQSWNGFR
ncbi:8159_t:CDS:2, partial [Gigaspora margarita]